MREVEAVRQLRTVRQPGKAKCTPSAHAAHRLHFMTSHVSHAAYRLHVMTLHVPMMCSWNFLAISRSWTISALAAAISTMSDASAGLFMSIVATVARALSTLAPPPMVSFLLLKRSGSQKGTPVSGGKGKKKKKVPENCSFSGHHKKSKSEPSF